MQVRKDFSETAAFRPHLRIRQGQGPFSFTAPERLTSWRVSGSVLTRDIQLGRFSEETVTRKELMVRVEMPRFLREGDESALTAVVHNETDSEPGSQRSVSRDMTLSPPPSALKTSRGASRSNPIPWRPSPGR